MSGVNDPLLITENGYTEKQFKDYKIRVYHDDGTTPRFHLIHDDKDTCINLFDSSYTGSILPNETFVELYEYLSADEDIFNNSIINWRGLCVLWDGLGNDMSNFDYCSLSSNNLIPNYTKIQYKGDIVL